VSATRYLHPAYGLGYPSLRLRERLRISAISASLGAVVGAIAGASGVAVLLSDHDMHAARQPMLAADSPHVAVPVAAAPQTDGAGARSSQPAAPPAAAERPSAHAEGPCEIESWVRLEGRCIQPMRTRRVLVGGPDAQPTPDTATAATEMPSTPAAAVEASTPVQAEPAAPAAPAAAPVARKKKKAARRPTRQGWTWQAARGEWNAYGYAGYYEGRGRSSRGYERSWQWGR
jgi:hypothetical protein